MSRLESSIQRSIIQRLKKAGYVVDKPVDRSHTGFPDITAYKHPGYTVFIEAKRPGEQPKPLQIYWNKKLRNMGFDAYILDNTKDLKKLGIIG